MNRPEDEAMLQKLLDETKEKPQPQPEQVSPGGMLRLIKENGISAADATKLQAKKLAKWTNKQWRNPLMTATELQSAHHSACMLANYVAVLEEENRFLVQTMKQEKNNANWQAALPQIDSAIPALKSEDSINTIEVTTLDDGSSRRFLDTYPDGSTKTRIVAADGSTRIMQLETAEGKQLETATREFNAIEKR